MYKYCTHRFKRFASRIKKSFKKKQSQAYPHKKIKRQRSYLSFNDPLALPWRINGRSSILACWRGASVMARGDWRNGGDEWPNPFVQRADVEGALYRDSLDTIGSVARPFPACEKRLIQQGQDRLSWFESRLPSYFCSLDLVLFFSSLVSRIRGARSCEFVLSFVEKLGKIREQRVEREREREKIYRCNFVREFMGYWGEECFIRGSIYFWI